MAVIYTTRGKGTHPIHGAYLGPDSVWYPVSWTNAGFRYKVSNPHPLDITLEIDKLGVEEEKEEVGA